MSLFPGDKLPESEIQYIDILVHILMYASWIFVVFLEKGKQFFQTNKRYFIGVAIFFILFGGIMEILQEFIAHRRFGSWSDFAANALGCILGLVILNLYVAKQKTN